MFARVRNKRFDVSFPGPAFQVRMCSIAVKHQMCRDRACSIHIKLNYDSQTSAELNPYRLALNSGPRCLNCFINSLEVLTQYKMFAIVT